MNPLKALAAVATTAILVTVSAQAADAADNPYERGPAPTTAALDASAGPYAVAQTTVSTASGFKSATIYYPTTTTDGTFGGVAIAPGFTEYWSQLSWLGPRIASHGFVVIGIDTLTTLDQPDQRGDELLAALNYLTTQSAVRSRVDAARLAVAGHSMGGGGSLEASQDRPSLQAAVPLAPWDTTKSWTGIKVPTLIIGAQNDSIAPVASHSIPFYNSIPAATEKAYTELRGADHLFPLSVNTLTGRMSVAWLKRFVDNDTRYDQFLCPGPTGTDVSDYRNTCPLS